MTNGDGASVTAARRRAGLITPGVNGSRDQKPVFLPWRYFIFPAPLK